MYHQRKDIIERINKRKLQREEFNKRGTHQANQRLKIIVDLGKAEKEGGDMAEKALALKKDTTNDNFGVDDDDWNVYKDIQKDRFSEDDDDDHAALTEVEDKIADLDQDFNLMLYQQSGG